MADGAVVWLTGLPGSGKTTLATAAAERVRAAGRVVRVLDGDALRTGLNADLGFSPRDRAENIRRTAHVAALLADSGIVAVVALVSPLRADRAMARDIVTRRHPFFEVHVAADLATCEARDPKGMYGRARRGEIADFTGVSAPYEPPQRPDLTLDTGRLHVEASVAALVSFLTARLAPSDPVPARE